MVDNCIVAKTLIDHFAFSLWSLWDGALVLTGDEVEIPTARGSRL
jgi:hypothetical protein